MVNKALRDELTEIIEKENWLIGYTEIYKSFCDPKFVSAGHVCVRDGYGRSMYIVRTHIYLSKGGNDAGQHLTIGQKTEVENKVAFGSVLVVGHKIATPVLFLTEKQARTVSLRYIEYPIIERKYPHRGEPYLCFPSLVQFLRILSLLSAAA